MLCTDSNLGYFILICGGGKESTGWEQEMGQKRACSVPTTTTAGEGSLIPEETEKQGKPHSSVIPPGKARLQVLYSTSH